MFYTYNKQQDEIINQLLNGQLRIDFKKITLSKNGISIDGNGFVYQNKSKELKLVFFRRELLSSGLELRNFIDKGNTKGGYQKADCNLDAIDIHGIQYSSTCFFDIETALDVEEIKLYKLKSNNKENSNRVILNGNYKIPNNSNYVSTSSFEPFGEKIGITANNKFCKLILTDSIELNLQQYKEHAELVILSKDELDIITFNKILHSIEFLIGDTFEVAYYSIDNVGTYYFSFDKISTTKPMMDAPILRSIKHEIVPEYEKLIQAYFKYIKSAPDELYKDLQLSHKRIIASSRLFTFIFGQTLAIQIEYLTSRFFGDYNLKLENAAEFSQDIQSMIKYINDTKFKHCDSIKWAISRLKPGLTKEKPTPSKLIKQLIDNKYIYGNFTSWEKLRHSTAHGSNKYLEQKELLKDIDICTEIYYTMIYNIIGFEGVYFHAKVDDYGEFRRYKLRRYN